MDEGELENWVVSWILYGVEGIILTITNFPIVLVVLLFSKLRQQKEVRHRLCMKSGQSKDILGLRSSNIFDLQTTKLTAL